MVRESSTVRTVFLITRAPVLQSLDQIEFPRADCPRGTRQWVSPGQDACHRPSTLRQPQGSLADTARRHGGLGWHPRSARCRGARAKTALGALQLSDRVLLAAAR